METKELNYYYIFGVRTDHNKDMKPKLSADFIIEFTDIDIINCDLAKAMVENKMCPTTRIEAIDGVGLSSLNETLNMMSRRARANMMTVHKLISEIPLERKDIDMFVSVANINESSRKKLVDSIIKF